MFPKTMPLRALSLMGFFKVGLPQLILEAGAAAGFKPRGHINRVGGVGR